MRPVDAVRALLSIVLASAIVWMPAAPPVHAHRAGIEGRHATVVHAHPQGPAPQAHEASPAPQAHEASPAPRAHDAGSHATATVGGDHGDHLRAIFIDATFERVAKRDLSAAPVPAEFQLPASRAAGSIVPDTAARAHAPPLLRWVTRGPPTLS
jgi:hypothetical protein